MKPIHRILVPVDGGLEAAATSAAVDLARQYGAEVVVFHAYEPPAYIYPTIAVDALPVTLETSEDVALAAVETLVDGLRQRSPDVRVRGVTRRGFAREQILDAIRDLDCDLVVMATHGRRGLSRAVLGSVAEQVVRRSPVPVLTVHPTATAA
jgi:nucleotide-binding universal stress UspA family protein